MARNTRKKAVTSEAPTADADTSFNPADLDPAMRQQAATIVQDVAERTRLPDDVQREAAHETGHSHTARHQQHREQGQSHADAVGKRPQIIESGITYSANDLLAGVRMGEGFRLVGGMKIKEGIIKFEEKPSPAVIQMMHDAKFKWLPDDKLWVLPIRQESAWQDRAHVEETFAAVSSAIRQERGINHDYGTPG